MPPLSAPEAIVRRRAVRHFDPDRPVPEEVLKAILYLATLAPSGYNLQPWRFLVVRSRRNRERLRACAFGQAKVAEAPVVLIVLGYLHPHRSHLEAMLAEQLRRGVITPEAAAALRAKIPRALERLPDRTVWATRSAMMAAALLMIAAESLGVASAPMEGFDPEKIRREFGVPNDHTIGCLIALGYAAETGPFPGRFPLEQVCYEEHFGQPWTLGEPTQSRPLDSASSGAYVMTGVF
ncbi:MAG: nitroreductase family protein [Isosphaeraceae bacterium]|nr:nitroreductase family protein [Isosphaeraceae bacterium]